MTHEWRGWNDEVDWWKGKTERKEMTHECQVGLF